MLIIGDIHGCYDELLALLEHAGVRDGEWIVSVGDLVDRGPDPRSVIDLFRSRANSVVLCGNHERKHVRGGGVLSYSQQVTRAQLGDRYADDVAWMATLPYHFETDDVAVVHFGLYPGVPLAEVPEAVRAGTTSGVELLRERYGETNWFPHYTDAKPVAFGHAVYDQPFVLDNRVFGIDTGACHGMALTGLRIPERRLFSVPARADYWETVKRQWQGPVMLAYDWAAMAFEQIDRKLRKLRDPELGDAPFERIARWVAELRAALPVLRARLEDQLLQLQRDAGDDVGRAIAAHPAAHWLQRWRLGKLSPHQLGCSSPRDVLALARALGVELAERPAV